jgi:uncharacterized membrane protein YsdA (DUF1294 family)
MSKTGRIFSYSLQCILLVLTMALILTGALTWPLILTWLVGINVVTLVYYGIDKLNAEAVERQPDLSQANVRIPEPALLLLALLGGSVMAMVSIMLFTHKPNKTWFILRLLIILALQGALIYYFRDRLPVM